jgi:Fe-S cluster biogenesis protein NfuA
MARSERMLKDEVEKLINEIRPQLIADGGDIELVDVDKEGIVKVKLKGACAGCPMSQITLQLGVERYLKSKVPKVKRVISV